MKARRQAVADPRGLWIEHGSDERILVVNGTQPAVLGAGWTPRFAYVGFAPFLLLELQHQDGHQASWILDRHGRRLGGQASDLHPEQQEALLARARAAMLAVVAVVLVAMEPAAGPEEDYFALSPAIRHELQRLCGLPNLVTPRVVPLDRCGAIPLPREQGGALLLSPAGLQAAMATDLQAQYLEACRTGVLNWPSPIDGAAVDEVRGMVLSPLLQAWRCPDRGHGVVFFVIAAGFKQETAAIWFPAARVLVTQPAASPWHFDIDAASLVQWMCEHVLDRGAALMGFLGRPIQRFAHFMWPVGSAHIGHYLWNELSGLEIAADNLETVQYPLVYDLGGAGGSAFYGPLALVFPELRGLITDARTGLADMLDSAYAGSVQVLRFSGNFISANMRQRIANVVSGIPAAEAARVALARGTGPVVVIGLRVENRTLVDLAGFYVALVRRLAERFGALRVIIDGHNSRDAADRTATYASFLEHRAARRPIEVEYEMVAAIKAGLAGVPAQVIDCVGMTMLDNLAWLLPAQYCVAPWGAGLAKYRWVCNLPGTVLLSRFNRVSKNDINIYHDSDVMEAPTPLAFVDPALVTDRPDAGVLVQMDPIHVPYYINYEVDAAAAGDIGDALTALSGWANPRPHAGFTITDDVLTGGDGQLFLANGGHDILSHVLGQRAPLASSYANFAGNIAGRMAAAASLGARYAHVVFPDKQTVLQDEFGVAAPHCLGEHYARRCSAAWAQIVYPVAALRAGPPGSYLRTDTHMTHQGTLIVAAALLARLFGSASHGWVAALQAAPRGRRRYAGDLGRKLDPVQDEEQVFIEHNPAIHAWSNQLNSGNNGSVTTYMFAGAPLRQRLVILGDSFGADLAVVLAHLFGTVMFFRTPFWHPELVAPLRPDVVVSENVERYLSHVVADADRPDFTMMNAMVHGETPERRDYARVMSAQASFGRGPYQRLMDGMLYGAR